MLLNTIVTFPPGFSERKIFMERPIDRFEEIRVAVAQLSYRIHELERKIDGIEKIIVLAVSTMDQVVSALEKASNVP